MGKKGSANFGAQGDVPMEPTYKNASYQQDAPPTYDNESYKNDDADGEKQPAGEKTEKDAGQIIEDDDDYVYDPDAPCSERYPPSTYFIIGMEFCERYCYYGMKAILILYFTEILLMSDDDATTLYHTFVMLCYLSPIGGAMLSDGFWGKYKTIFLISWIYLAGCLVMSLSAIPAIQAEDPLMAGTVIGLLLIATGTGGIKPCVAAFGGDQFRKEQTSEIQTYFLLYYLAINLGSLLSTFLTPILREYQCFGNDCYPLAFGVPAILLLVAICVFVLGRYTVGYKIYPGEGNIVWEVTKAIGHACGQKWKFRKDEDKKSENPHWMDYAFPKYDKSLINDTKCLCHVLIMFIPLPVYWALFDQQGSRWTLQATQMDCQIGSITIEPDQMQVLNPLFIVCMIPVFDNCIYPLLKKCGIRCTYLQRMCWGMLFASIAFYCACIVQLFVNQTVSVPPCSQGATESGITIINAAHCNLTVTPMESPDGEDHGSVSVPYGEFSEYLLVKPGNFTLEYKCSSDDGTIGGSLSFPAVNCEAYRFIVGSFKSPTEPDKLQLQATLVIDLHDKPDRGTAFTSLVFAYDFGVPYVLVNLTGKDLHYDKRNATQVPTTPESDVMTDFRITQWEEYEPDDYKISISKDDGTTWEEWSYEENKVIVKNGAAYSVVWYLNQTDDYSDDFKEEHFQMTQHTTVPANTVNILWQIPQYFIITCGEIMFSITGLEFSYAQAPASMKSSLQACWLLTIAFGNLIVIVQSAVAPPRSMAIDFFFFGTLMLVVFFIFVAMSVWYVYIEPTYYNETYEEDDGDEEKKPIPNGDGVEAKKDSPDTSDGESQKSD